MTAFDKKVNQIAARHRWNIEKQARAAVPCYIIQKLRREMTYTRRPDLVQNGIDHARLALKCAYRGYMYTI